MNQAKRCNVVM